MVSNTRVISMSKKEVNPKCPICGVFLSPTKAGSNGTTGSDLAGTGVEYYCKKCGSA